MATTTSKRTKANTKTAKKTSAARSTASKKTATKVTKSATAKASAVKNDIKHDVKVKSAKVSRRSMQVTAQTLKQLHIVSAAVFVILAGLAGWMMQTQTYQLTLGHLTSDGLLSTSNTVFAPAEHSIMSLDLRWGLVAVLVISAVISLLRATRYQSREAAGYAKQSLPLRWVDLGITFAALTSLSFMMTGMQDIVSLKFAGLLIAAWAIFSWMAERGVAEKTHYRGTHFTALLAWVLTWIGVAAYLIATPLYGDVRASWYVYSAIGSVFAGFVLLEMTKGMQITGKFKSYIIAERNYAVINLLVKLAFSASLIAALHK